MCQPNAERLGMNPNRTETIAIPLLEPDPLFTLVCQSRNAAGWTSAITRVWPAGVTYCGRCPLSDCTLHGGVCLLTVQEYVPEEEAESFRVGGRVVRPSASGDLSLVNRAGRRGHAGGHLGKPGA